MYHRHLKTPSLLQVHGTTSSVVFVFTPLTIRTLHLPATSHDSVRVVQKSWTHWTWHAAPVTWLDPYSLLFCVLWQTCSWPVYLILTWQFTPTLAWILRTLYTNNAICDPKSTESEHARKKYRKSTPSPETNHSDPSPTPRPSKCSTTHTLRHAKWYKMVQNDAKWCKMVQNDTNSCRRQFLLYSKALPPSTTSDTPTASPSTLLGMVCCAVLWREQWNSETPPVTIWASTFKPHSHTV